MTDVPMVSLDSFKCRSTLSSGGKTYVYYSLPLAEANGLKGISRLPFSMKVLLENLLRHEDGRSVTKADIEAVAAWLVDKGTADKEIGFRPARVLMQDFTGVPAVVDLAAMRDGMKALGGDPQKINPLVPVDLVIDHSVIVDEFGTPQAIARNVEHEYQRNIERYNFLKWGQGAFDNFRVVPPGTGICHQVNLEFLAQTVWTKPLPDGTTLAYPDTLVGTDSHTTMVNGLAVLGWGVGGIEAEAAMLGQPQSMLIPQVVGFKLTGKLKEGVTATDLVLTVTQMLRKKGVVNKFVEFFGPGLDTMPLADRATIANMAPEYGATCGFFPVDNETLDLSRHLGPRGAPHRAGRGLFEGAGHVPRAAACPTPCSPTRSSSISLPSCPRSPGRSAPRAASHSPTYRAGFAKALETEYKKPGELDRARPRRGPRLRHRPRRRRHRRDHELHQYVEPQRAHRRRAARQESGREGPDQQTMGEDLAGARIAGRLRLPRQGRPAALPRQARVQPRRLRLHHLHRELGALGAGDLRRHQREGHRRRGRAVGQPQLRGPRQPRRAGELPRLPAARRRLRARGLGQDRPHERAARSRQRRQPRLPQGHLADLEGDPDLHRGEHHALAVRRALRRRLQWRCELALHRCR